MQDGNAASARRPVVALIGSWWHEGAHGVLPASLGSACVIVYLVCVARLSLVDVLHHRLPRVWVHQLSLVLGIGLPASALCGGEPARVLTSAAGALGTRLLYGTVRALSPAWLGRGDVRLAPVLGAACGFVSPVHAVAAVVLTFGACGAWGTFLVLSRRARPHDRIAMGPWMSGCSTLVWLALPPT